MAAGKLSAGDGPYHTLDDFVGSTPLVRLKRLPGRTSNVVLAKLEGNNPAGSVKDRPALSMIVHAEERGEIKPGDTLIEPTSGNPGIALANERILALQVFLIVVGAPLLCLSALVEERGRAHGGGIRPLRHQTQFDTALGKRE